MRRTAVRICLFLSLWTSVVILNNWVSLGLDFGQPRAEDTKVDTRVDIIAGYTASHLMYAKNAFSVDIPNASHVLSRFKELEEDFHFISLWMTSRN